MHASKVAASLSMALCLLNTAACGVIESGPSEQEVAEIVRKKIPEGLEIGDFRFKTFPSEGGQGGRISVAGTLVSTEPRVEVQPNPFARLRQQVLALGASEDQYQRYSALNKLNSSIYTIIAPADAKYEFSGELLYHETVDGYQINGEIKKEGVPGRALSQLAKGELAYDTPEFERFFSRYVEAHNHETIRLPKVINDLFSKLADGGEIVDESRVLAMIEPFDLKKAAWTVKDELRDGHYVQVYDGTAPVAIDAIEEIDLSARKIPKGKSRLFDLQVRVNYKNPGPTNACVNFTYRGGYKFNELCWDGAVWRWDGRQYGGIKDAKTGRQLSISPDDKVPKETELRLEPDLRSTSPAAVNGASVGDVGGEGAGGSPVAGQTGAGDPGQQHAARADAVSELDAEQVRRLIVSNDNINNVANNQIRLCRTELAKRNAMRARGVPLDPLTADYILSRAFPKERPYVSASNEPGKVTVRVVSGEVGNEVIEIKKPSTPLSDEWTLVIKAADQ